MAGQVEVLGEERVETSVECPVEKALLHKVKSHYGSASQSLVHRCYQVHSQKVNSITNKHRLYKMASQ